jgi:hypothetical protein
MQLGNAFALAGENDRAEAIIASAALDARAEADKAVSLSSLEKLSKPLYDTHQQLAFFQAHRGALFEAVCTLEAALAPSLLKRTVIKDVCDNLDAVQQERLSRLSQEHQRLTAKIEEPGLDLSEAFETTVGRINELNVAIREIIGAGDEDRLSLDLNEIGRSIPEQGALLIPLLWGGVWICFDNAGAERPRITKVECPRLWRESRNLATKLPFWDHVMEAVLDRDKPAAAELIAALESFGASVVRPLVHHLGSLGIARGSSIVMVAHGMLNLIPIHAATWGEGASQERLCELYDFAVVPSLIWLMKMSTNENSAQTETRRAIVVADSLKNLAGSRLEGELVADRLGRDNCVILRQDKATKAALIGALPAAEHLHIAGHSHYDKEMRFFSSVKLADADLTVADFLSQVSQAPGTVVLSSCTSGGGSGFRDVSENWGFSQRLGTDPLCR